MARKRASLSTANTEKLYDIVVHDCFSGGGVPKHIFTVEFWEDLKTIVSPEGVVAVVSVTCFGPYRSGAHCFLLPQNFAGHLGSDASRAILLTLQQIFAQCRAFHDSIEGLTEEQYRHEFVNMVSCSHIGTNLLNSHAADIGLFLYFISGTPYVSNCERIRLSALIPSGTCPLLPP